MDVIQYNKNILTTFNNYLYYSLILNLLIIITVCYLYNKICEIKKNSIISNEKIYEIIDIINKTLESTLSLFDLNNTNEKIETNIKMEEINEIINKLNDKYNQIEETINEKIERMKLNIIELEETINNKCDELD